MKENVVAEKSVGVNERVMEISTGPIQRRRRCVITEMARKLLPLTIYYYANSNMK